MQTRPKIKLETTPFERVLETASALLLCFLWGFTLYAYTKLPQIIPTHFNAAGKPDDYGDKLTLLLLPAIATLLYFGLSYLNKFPHHFNYTVTITADNAAQQYRSATQMILFLKLVILLIFFAIVLLTYSTANGTTTGLGILFLPLTVAVLFIPIVVLMVQSQKKK